MTVSKPPLEPKSGLSPGYLIIFCGFLMTLSAFSIDIMLPAFGAMALELDEPIEWIQATIPVYSISFAIAQLFWGPLSDRFGRRPVIVIGLGIYLAGALLAALSSSLFWLLVGRAIQGFGASAAPVIGRAIMRDSYCGPALARAMGATMAVFAIGPILAPLMGTGLMNALGWRFVFIAMALFAAGILVIALGPFRETNQNPDPDALKIANLMAAFRRVVTNRQSIYVLFFATCAYCALLSFVSNGVRVYETAFDVTGLEFAILFTVSGFGIILGQFCNRILLARLGILKTLQVASFILFFASASTALLGAANLLDAWSFTALMFLFNTSFLVVISNSLTLIIDPHPQIAGFVSAFFGFASLTGSAFFVIVTFRVFDGQLVPWAVGMTAMTAIAFCGFLCARRASFSYRD